MTQPDDVGPPILVLTFDPAGNHGLALVGIPRYLGAWLDPSPAYGAWMDAVDERAAILQPRSIETESDYDKVTFVDGSSYTLHKVTTRAYDPRVPDTATVERMQKFVERYEDLT